MNSFHNHRLRDHALPMSTAWLLNDIAEAKGRQELYILGLPRFDGHLGEAACRGKYPAARWEYLGSKGINS